MTRNDIRDLLDEQLLLINHTSFIAADPVQFPRRFSAIRDIEPVAFLSAAVAWGTRRSICSDIEKMLSLMNHEPAEFIASQAYEELPDRLNIHRTFFGSHLKYFLRGLHAIYERHESLDAFAASHSVGSAEAPAWKFAELLAAALADANGGEYCSQCVPLHLDTTPLKRINMALRWLVRDDGIVDMGVWHSIPKSKLYVPLDVHVGNTARDLGLITRRSNDRRALEMLMEPLREWRPDDPAAYDYALFGMGINKSL